MKKVVYALAALSMVALMGLTSCSNSSEPKYTIYADVMALNKYVGMNLADAKTQVENAGWVIGESGKAGFDATKQVDGHAVEAVFMANANSACSSILANISDDNSIANGTTLFNQIGETYKFQTLNQTANFYYFWGELSDRKEDVSTYSASQDWLKTNADACIAFQGAWITSDKQTAMAIEALKGKQLLEVQFMNGIVE